MRFYFLLLLFHWWVLRDHRISAIKFQQNKQLQKDIAPSNTRPKKTTKKENEMETADGIEISASLAEGKFLFKRSLSVGNFFCPHPREGMELALQGCPTKKRREPLKYFRRHCFPIIFIWLVWLLSHLDATHILLRSYVLSIFQSTALSSTSTTIGPICLMA